MSAKRSKKPRGDGKRAKTASSADAAAPAAAVSDRVRIAQLEAELATSRANAFARAVTDNRTAMRPVMRFALQRFFSQELLAGDAEVVILTLKREGLESAWEFESDYHCGYRVKPILDVQFALRLHAADKYALVQVVLRDGPAHHRCHGDPLARTFDGSVCVTVQTDTFAKPLDAPKFTAQNSRSIMFNVVQPCAVTEGHEVVKTDTVQTMLLSLFAGVAPLLRFRFLELLLVLSGVDPTSKSVAHDHCEHENQGMQLLFARTFSLTAEDEEADRGVTSAIKTYVGPTRNAFRERWEQWWAQIRAQVRAVSA